MHGEKRSRELARVRDIAGRASGIDACDRRLGPYAPEHLGVDVTAILQQVAAAEQVVRSGLLELPQPL